ncbi:MAG TPA: hypothetical protein VMW75_22350 [Thermoanaerobaculia bacterium]|nr:hypothetical protein [Thermoanaerobaculia bacterium]
MPQSTSTKGLPEPIFYADENFGSAFISSLRVNGNLQVRAARDFFAGQDDVIWIPAVASNGWTAITKDLLEDNLEEQVALMSCGAKVFMLIGRATDEERAILFLRKIKWVRKQIATRDEAFLGKIYMRGGATAVVTLTEFCSRSRRRWGR